MSKEKNRNTKKILSILTAFTIGFSPFAPLTQYVVSAANVEVEEETEELETDNILEAIEDFEEQEDVITEKNLKENDQKSEEKEHSEPVSEDKTEKAAVLKDTFKEAVVAEEEITEVKEELSAEETKQVEEIIEYINNLPEPKNVTLSNSRIPSEYIRKEIDKLSASAKEEITNLEKLVAIEKRVQELMNTIIEEPAPATDHGSKAYNHIVYLTENLNGDRVSGTKYELEAAHYIKSQFESYNYDTKLVPFTFEGRRGDQKGKTIDSQNIIAVKEGTSGKEVILGAHYDQVIDGGSDGASDNASGIGGMLEVAERLQDIKTEHTIIFVAFGSEEVGLEGSKAFVKMDDFNADKVLGMINLDTILAGDYAYVYSGTNGKGIIRDKALSISRNLGLDLVTQEGEVEGHNYGETGDWSDHAPFNELGIPVAYFESTSWEIRDENYELMDGYTETGRGSIMHSGRDTLDYINTTFPGRAKKRLNTFVRVLEPLMKDLAGVVKGEVELNRDKLDNVMQKVDELVEDNYTSASWTLLSDALAMKESTQAEIDAKVDALEKALAGLVLIKDTDDSKENGEDKKKEEVNTGRVNGSEDTTGTGTTNDQKETGKLPQTGEANYQGQVWGLLSILAGSALVYGFNHKKRKELINK